METRVKPVYEVHCGEEDRATNARTAADRAPLTRDRILQAALELADRGGVEAVTMRDVSAALGVVPMALYRHVRNKDDLVDGIVDLVFLEIPLPVDSVGWKTALRDRSVALHDALLRHRWAVGLMESRLNPGPATLLHHDAVLGCLRAAGFSLDETAHVYSLIDSYVYGFALTQLTLPFETPDDVVDVAQAMLAPFPAGTYPNLAEFITDHAMQPGYAYANEFLFGLDLVLDGIERRVLTAR